jgi:iron complex transport system ATP-binding protein
MELGDLRRRAVETLSGGERRRAWLALVLSQEADVLLLDEPADGLDLRHRGELLARLAAARRERGATLVVVLHDLAEAAALADRVALLRRGRLYDCGPPARALCPESLRDVFEVDAEAAPDAAGRWRVTVRGPADPARFI